jgi:hypothetical protein
MKRRAKMMVAVALIFLSGCTGTKMMVRPELAGEEKHSGPCGSVAVRELTADRVYPPAGNLVPGFADALRESGLAKAVYYPSRPDDHVDYTLDAKFDVLFEPNMGSNMVKSFVTGLTLFLLEPAFWYDYDYRLKGEIGVYRGPVKLTQMQSEAEAQMQMKFLSLGEVQRLEGETLSSAKKTLYRQLLTDLNKACSH